MTTTTTTRRAAARTPRPLSGDDARLLSASALAERLCCSLSTAHRLIRSGALPVVRLDGIVRVRQGDVDAYVNGHTH